MKDKNRGQNSGGAKKGKLLEFEPRSDLEKPGSGGSGLGADIDPGIDTDGKKASDRNRNLRLVKALEMEEDEEAWEDEEDGQESPWVTALTFLGLAVLAAIICAVLWYFTHQDKPESGQDASVDMSGAVEPGDGAPDAGGISGRDPGAGEVSGLGAEDGFGQEKDPGTEDASGQESGTGGGAGTGQETESEEALPSGQESGADAALSGGQESEDGQEGQDPSEETVQEPEAGMQFTEQRESVTPKDLVNLRSVPSTADDDSIVVQCRNGEILTRIGINQDTGWSQLMYGDRILYAVSQYLTVDLDYKTPAQVSDPNRVSTSSGRVIVFSNCDDWISPKEYVNLRTEPSTDRENDTISCRLEYGEKVHRTGYSEDSGWSRVEYGGKVLYVVTSLIYEVEPD